MAKGDYRNSDVKSRYRNLAKARTDLKEASEKIVVSNDDKRTRAELLDIVEELFEPNTGQTVEKLRAVLYMIINSLGNFFLTFFLPMCPPPGIFFECFISI